MTGGRHGCRISSSPPHSHLPPLPAGKLSVAEACLWRASDFSGIMLLYAAQGNRQGLQALAERATEGGKHNVAFLALFLLGKLEECIQLLVAAKRWGQGGEAGGVMDEGVLVPLVCGCVVWWPNLLPPVLSLLYPPPLRLLMAAFF